MDFSPSGLSSPKLALFVLICRFELGNKLNLIDLIFLPGFHTHFDKEPEPKVNNSFKCKDNNDKYLRKESKKSPIIVDKVSVHFVWPTRLQRTSLAETYAADYCVYYHYNDCGDEDFVIGQSFV